jgi:ankyrin repeat protein
MTMLHDVADFHHEMTELLLGAEADPNAQDKKGKTPLHYAAEFNCPESIKMLLNAGANPNLQDKEGDTPLYLTNSPQNIAMLLNAKGNPHIQDKDGYTPLHIAAERDYPVNVQLLLDKGADPNIENNEGNTPFRLAITSEHVDIVESFLDNNGTDINLRHKKNGEPPIFDAIVTKTTGGKIADLIIANEKVDLSIRNKREMTVLHRAAALGRKDTIQMLFQRGVSISDVDNEGRSPLHFACANEWIIDNGNDNESRENGFDYSTIEKPNENVVAIINTLIGHYIKDIVTQIKEKERELQQEENEQGCIAIWKEIEELFLKHAIKIKEYINTKDKNGNTPLFYAIESGKCEVITKLLAEGAEVKVTDKNNYTPYYYAVKSKSPEILKLLVLTPFERGEIMNHIQHALMKNTSQEFSNMDNFVKQYNCFDIATYITEKVLPSISYKDNNEELIGKKLEDIFPGYVKEDKEFYDAIKTHISAIVESVVKTTNARLTVLDKKGNTLLHHAVKWGCSGEILDLLVKSGVDINAKNSNGVAPVHIAAKYGKLSQMQWLKELGADLDAKCGNFTKAETEILEKNFVTMQDGNMDASSSVSPKNGTTYENATPTFIAADNLAADVVHMLESEGANPNIPDKMGATPLHVVAARILKRDYGEDEISDIYSMFEGLALFSTDNLAHCKKLIEILGGDEQVKSRLNTFLDNVIQHKKGNQEPTAPMVEEVNAPDLDESFYNEIVSHIKEISDLYLDHSDNVQAPASVKYNTNEFDSDHSELHHQREVTAEEIERANYYGVGEWNIADEQQYQQEVSRAEIASEWPQGLGIRQSEWGEEGKLSGAKESWGQNKANATSSLSDQNHEQTQPIDINHKEPNTTISDPSVQEVSVEKRSPIKQTKRDALKLNEFLNKISKVQNMDQLNKIVDETLEAGVRINFSQDNGDSFTDRVAKKIHELEGAKASARIAGSIICKLISKGAIFNENYKEINNELKKLKNSKDHEINLQKANKEFCRYITKFQDIAKSSISEGKLKSIEIDNGTFSLEYSEDSIVEVAKVINGAKSLGLNQGNIEFRSNAVKIGKSKVEVETENSVRNYTNINISDGSNIVLTFPTNLGKLEVRLYPDTQNEGRIKVEINNKDRKKFDHLEDKEEIGKNCLLGGLSIYKAIEQGYFERSVSFQSSEIINLSGKVVEEAKKIVKDLNPRDMIVNSWADKTTQRSKIAEGRSIA